MKPVVISMATMEGDPVDTFRPDDPTDFLLQICLEMGFDGQKGSELYYATICSPKWLARRFSPDKVYVG